MESDKRCFSNNATIIRRDFIIVEVLSFLIFAFMAVSPLIRPGTTFGMIYLIISIIVTVIAIILAVIFGKRDGVDFFREILNNKTVCALDATLLGIGGIIRLFVQSSTKADTIIMFALCVSLLLCCIPFRKSRQ